MDAQTKNVLSEEKIKQIKESLKDANQLVCDTSIVKDNKIIFQENGTTYRVCMPNQRQTSEANNVKHQLYGELILTEGCYLKNRLKQILQEAVQDNSTLRARRWQNNAIDSPVSVFSKSIYNRIRYPYTRLELSNSIFTFQS